MAQRTFSATVEVPVGEVARIIKQRTNRELSQRMRRAGEESRDRANAFTHEFEERYDDRRRYPGTPHLADSIEVRHSGLDQVQGGQMRIDLLSSAPSFLYLEFGTPAHEIKPKPGKRLAWPGILLPIDFVVQHPGSTKWKGQWRRMVARTFRDRFPGIRIPAIK